MSSSQIQKELDAAIAHAKAHPDDTETQEQAMDLLVQKLADPEVLAQLIQEIKTLSQYSLDIQAAMGDVDDIFRKIQLSNVSNDIKNDVETLKHKWSGHMKTYVDLLWESRRVAATAESAAKDFAGDFIEFLNDEPTSLEDKRKEIAQYITQLQKDEKQAMSMSQGFSDLQRAIQDFREDWVIVAAKYNLDAMNAESQKLQAEIDSLTATLASLNAKIRDLWIATGTLMGATGVTTVLGLIMPIFFLGNIVTFLAMGPSVILLKKTQDEYKVKECELDAKKAEHARLMARIAAVEQLKAGLESSEGNFETIIPRLGAFSTVWAAIRADVHAVELKLKLTTNAATWRMMHKRLRTSTALYMALAKALHQYQISVDPDNEIFKANKQA